MLLYFAGKGAQFFFQQQGSLLLFSFQGGPFDPKPWALRPGNFPWQLI
jgi:hypothetical protein